MERKRARGALKVGGSACLARLASPCAWRLPPCLARVTRISVRVTWALPPPRGHPPFSRSRAYVYTYYSSQTFLSFLGFTHPRITFGIASPSHTPKPPSHHLVNPVLSDPRPFDSTPPTPPFPARTLRPPPPPYPLQPNISLGAILLLIFYKILPNRLTRTTIIVR